jgi:hypothetical protein
MPTFALSTEDKTDQSPALSMKKRKTANELFELTCAMTYEHRIMERMFEMRKQFH